MIHHGEFLRINSRDDHLVYHLERDWKGAELDDQDRVMLHFVEKLIFTPGKITADDVDTLRKVGFDDRGVLDVVMQTAMFNFMNRLADGVGIRAEDKFRALKDRKDNSVQEALSVEGAAD